MKGEKKSKLLYPPIRLYRQAQNTDRATGVKVGGRIVMLAKNAWYKPGQVAKNDPL